MNTAKKSLTQWVGLNKKTKRGRPKGSKNKKRGPIVKINIPNAMTPENKGTEGLYTSGSEDSFVSKREIDAKYLEKARIEIEEGSLPTNLTFEDFHQETLRRAEFREKVEGEKRHVEITIDTDRPVAIAFLSDLHLGSSGIDYELLKETADVIKGHPLAYCITAGDITDSLFFSYGDEVLNMQEQYVYMSKLLGWLGPENILAGIVGNHESWASKSGVTNYVEFSNHLQRPLLRGVSFVDLRVGKASYRLMMAHKFLGSSYINPTHQESRANREIPGADIVLAAHTHKPGESVIYQPEYGGGTRKVALVNGKTFKKTDSYGKDKGFTPAAGDELGCNWIILNHDRKMVRICSSNEEMIETMKAYV